MPKSKSERTKNIRDNRRNEKEANRQTEAFSLTDGETDEEAIALVQEDMSLENDEQITPMLALIKKMQEDRFNG